MAPKLIRTSPATLALSSPAVRVTAPRLPQRAAGKRRYALLLDAVDALLSERETGEIGLHDIAVQAGVPTASVYHFFPSMTAAVIGLAQRYLDNFATLLSVDLDHDSLASWRDVHRIKAGAGRAFHNAHDVARRLFLGSEYSWQVRQADIEGNRGSAHWFARDYARHFHVESSEHLVDKIEIAIGLSDAIWSLSYVRYGEITAAYALEAERAYHAYLSNYIPELVRMRTEPLEPASGYCA